jgi:hypothetical protein
MHLVMMRYFQLICKGYKRVLLPRMKADVEASFVCCPRAQSDVDEFLGIAEGGARFGQPEGSAWPADIVLLDQHIELPDCETVFGTDLARTLRERLFTGFIIIRSGNTTLDDNDGYMRKSVRDGTVDGFIGKAAKNNNLATQLDKLYTHHRNRIQQLSSDDSVNLSRIQTRSEDERPIEKGQYS